MYVMSQRRYVKTLRQDVTSGRHVRTSRQDVVTPPTGLNYTRGALVTSSESAIARWWTTAVTLFAIYR